MNRRKFVLTSTISMLVIAAAVAGLAFYSSFVTKAYTRGLPQAINYLPENAQAVFGMNVRRFVSSPFYAKFMETHEQKIGNDLSEFIAKTGVDPRTDIDYIIAAGQASAVRKGSGVMIAMGRFDPARITQFISSRSVPIKVDYKGATVLMIPESNGDRLEKGIAFLDETSEIALGDLESLKAVLDVRYHSAPGIEANKTLAPLLANLNPEEMFWFAGDAASILSKAPTGSPLGANFSAVQSVFGTLDLTDAVIGKITATATDEEAAAKLADVVRGFVALGQLASSQNADLAALLNKGVAVTQSGNQIDLTLNFPIELLEKLKDARSQIQMKKIL